MVAAVTERQADMVVGDRLSSTYYTQNKRPFHNFGNDLVRFFTNHLFGGKIKDIMTGYRAFSYQFVKTYPVLSRGLRSRTEMTTTPCSATCRSRTLSLTIVTVRKGRRAS